MKNEGKYSKKVNIDWKKIESNILFSLIFTLIAECLIEIYLFFGKKLDIKRETFSLISIFIIIYFFKSFAFNKERLNRFNLIKIMFSFILMTATSIFWKTFHYAMFGYIEIVFITLLSSLLINRKPKLSRFLNNFFSVLFNLDVGVCLFSKSYIIPVMLSNLASIHDIGGRAIIYISAFIVVCVISCLPFKNVLDINKKDKDNIDDTTEIENEIKKSKLKTNKKLLLPIFLLIAYYVVLCILIKINFSPLGNYYCLIRDEIYNLREYYIINYKEFDKKIYYNKEIKDYINPKLTFTEKPNVIVIFVEGLSQSIVEDSRDIMTNVKKYQEQGISFVNYNNHTFATYRGLIGQLFSGYQFNNNDENHLISLQSILKKNGYYTSFINVEPFNNDFSHYLDTLGFDEVITDNKNTRGFTKVIADKDAYTMLFDHAIELDKKSEPFLLGLYTVETHVTFNDADEQFGNGQDIVLNRFYNADFQFGAFMDKFINSDLFDNTIVVFTTDHASYNDLDFHNAFPDLARGHNCLDRIPFIIYHKDIEHQYIDANYRNSLDLTPTILDYLNISAPNYFLGTSLFNSTDDYSEFEHYYRDDNNYWEAKDGELKRLYIQTDGEIITKIIKYFSISSK